MDIVRINTLTGPIRPFRGMCQKALGQINNLYLHHREGIIKATQHFMANPNYRAVLIGGSIADHRERIDSDIDLILVVNDNTFYGLQQKNNLHFHSEAFTDYPGVYVEGKIINLKFLKDAAERGSEPTRSSYENVWISYSKVDGLKQLLKRIPVYPLAEQKTKIENFHTYFEYSKWLFDEAVKREDTFLLNQAVTDLILFGGRLILAHNQILYPGPKKFMSKLEEAKLKPADLMALISTLLAKKSINNAEQFYAAIAGFIKWETPPETWPARFMNIDEQAWLKGKSSARNC